MNNSISIFYKTDKMYLTPFTSEIAYSSNYPHWFNIQDVTRFSQHGCFPMTKPKIDSFIAGLENNNSIIVMAIIEPKRNIHVGNVSLQSIDWINRSAELAIIIGEQEYWGTGIGYDACKSMTTHAFTKLNLNRVWLGCSEFNTGMIHIACKLDMQLEGKLKQAFYCGQEYYNVHRYGLLKEEWRNG